jgi:translation initiation factor 2 subunit 3
MSSKSPELTISLAGHIDHGKTTLTRALTGKWTDTHSEENKRGMTIKLGYADLTFRKCPKCKEPGCYTADVKCGVCGTKTEDIRTASFIDVPGHEALMTTMLSGASLVDGAVLVISAKDKCPQPQTREHLMALELLGIKNLIVAQNKVDLVTPERAKKSYQEIKEFIKGTVAENVPIIPVSAQFGANIDILLEAIDKFLPTPKRETGGKAKMVIVRTFDINKPGSDIDKLKGGVLGGAVVRGSLKVGDKIEIKPGKKIKKQGVIACVPINTEIVSAFTGGQSVKEVHPGGSIALGTLLDPAVSKSDQLAGNIVGKPGETPPIVDNLRVNVELMERIVGTEEQERVKPIAQEPLLLNVGPMVTSGVVTKVKGNEVELVLKIPICAEVGDKLAISRRVGTRWRLIGMGTVI